MLTELVNPSPDVTEADAVEFDRLPASTALRVGVIGSAGSKCQTDAKFLKSSGDDASNSSDDL